MESLLGHLPQSDYFGMNAVNAKEVVGVHGGSNRYKLTNYIHSRFEDFKKVV